MKFTFRRLAIALCVCLLAVAGLAAGPGESSQPLPQREIVPAPTPALTATTEATTRVISATTRLSAASTRLGADPDLMRVAPPVGRSTALVGVMETTLPASHPATSSAPASRKQDEPKCRK